MSSEKNLPFLCLFCKVTQNPQPYIRSPSTHGLHQQMLKAPDLQVKRDDFTRAKLRTKQEMFGQVDVLQSRFEAKYLGQEQRLQI